MLKGITVAVFVALAMGCTPKKEEAAAPVVDKDQIKTELQAIESAFAEAYNSRKLEGVVYYADDATSFSQNKPPLVGKAAIDKYIKEDQTGFPKGAKLAFEVLDVFPSSDGNQVVEIGSYKMSDSTNTAKTSGHYMSLFEKRDGKYVCIRDMGASDMPKEEKK